MIALENRQRQEAAKAAAAASAQKLREQQQRLPTTSKTSLSLLFEELQPAGVDGHQIQPPWTTDSRSRDLQLQQDIENLKKELKEKVNDVEARRMGRESAHAQPDDVRRGPDNRDIGHAATTAFMYSSDKLNIHNIHASIGSAQRPRNVDQFLAQAAAESLGSNAQLGQSTFVHCTAQADARTGRVSRHQHPLGSAVSDDSAKAKSGTPKAKPKAKADVRRVKPSVLMFKQSDESFRTAQAAASDANEHFDFFEACAGTWIYLLTARSRARRSRPRSSRSSRSISFDLKRSMRSSFLPNRS